MIPEKCIILTQDQYYITLHNPNKAQDLSINTDGLWTASFEIY